MSIASSQFMLSSSKQEIQLLIFLLDRFSISIKFGRNESGTQVRGESL